MSEACDWGKSAQISSIRECGGHMVASVDDPTLSIPFLLGVQGGTIVGQNINVTRIGWECSLKDVRFARPPSYLYLPKLPDIQPLH